MRTVYKNGTVYTGNGFVTDFAVENGKFCFVGETDKAAADEVVDLDGKFVCAGFNDSHMHVLTLGNVLTMANLGAHTTSLKEMLDCLRTYIKETGVTPGTWVQGRGFNHDYFADERRFPTRWDLDAVSTEHPICITRACGHICVVNSKALEVLGITKDTPQVAGGSFALDENGEPNGQFFENAVAVVYAGIPEPDEAQLCAMLRASCKRLNRYGITSCQSDDYETFPGVPYETVQKLLRTPGLMTVRVNEQAQFTNVEALSAYIESGDAYFEDDMFRAGPLKIISDGSLGARTACLSRPYADDENARGIPLYTNAELNGLISLANEKGLSVAVHAIGDGALDNVLDAYEKALHEHPRDDHRHGIVHCQIVRRDQIERMKKLKLRVNLQSIFLDYDTHIVRERVGDELASTSYPAKTLLNEYIPFSNGSDAPVEEPELACVPDQRGDLVVAVDTDAMGRGSEELGRTLMKGFLYAVSQLPALPKTILFYNSGAYLTCAGSDSLEDLKFMEAQGVEIRTCGTCLDFYKLKETLAVGSVTNMYAIAETLAAAGKVIKP